MFTSLPRIQSREEFSFIHYLKMNKTLKLKEIGLQNNKLHTDKQLACSHHAVHTESLKLIVISFLNGWVKPTENCIFVYTQCITSFFSIVQVLLIFFVSHALLVLP